MAFASVLSCFLAHRRHRSRSASIAKLSAAVARAALLVATVGCGSGPRTPDIGRLPLITSSNPAAEADLGKARAARDEDNQILAEAHYRAFLEHHQQDPLAVLAELELGQLLLDKDPAQAQPLFERVARHEQPAIGEQGRFFGAVVAHRLGRSQEAVAVLAGMVGRTISAADTVLLLTTLAQAQLDLGNTGRAVVALDRLAAAEVPEAERQKAEKTLASLVDERATADEVDTLTRELPQEGPGYRYAMRRAVRDAQANHDGDRARLLVARMVDAGLPLDEELQEIAARASQAGDADPRAVGAILSLSGRGRRLGEQALRGLMLAAGLPPQEPTTAATPQLIFRDDGGDPERAAAAVDELASVHRVIAIVGPMGSATARSAAERASDIGIPLLTLTPTAGLVDVGQPVFQMLPTPHAEVTALVDRAVADGARRFALLAPQGAYGDAMAGVLREAVEALGATLTSAQRYAPDATAFGQEIAALAGAKPQAILIADSPTRLALIAPALAAAGLWSTPPGEKAPSGAQAVQLLAPAVAFDHGAAARSARYLQGALFAVPFDPVTATGSARRFATKYKRKYDSTANTFAALAYDAYLLVEMAAETAGASREGVTEELRQLRHPRLAGPSDGFARDGSLKVPTRLLRFGPDGFEPATR